MNLLQEKFFNMAASGLDFFQFEFLQWAVLGTLFVSLMAGLFSPFVVAKRLSFMGEAIGHSTLVGLTLSSFFFPQQPFLSFLMTLLTTLLLVSFLAYTIKKQLLPQDALTGIFLAVSLAVGVLLHTILNLQQEDLVHFLFGNILFIHPSDLLMMFVFASLALSIFILFFRHWIYELIDPSGCKLVPLPTSFMHFTFFFLLTIFIILAIKLVGTILINTFLLLPALYAFKTATNIRTVFIRSISFSLGSCLLGLFLMNLLNLPAGAILALTQFCCFLFSGILLRWKQRRR